MATKTTATKTAAKTATKTAKKSPFTTTVESYLEDIKAIAASKGLASDDEALKLIIETGIRHLTATRNRKPSEKEQKMIVLLDLIDKHNLSCEQDLDKIYPSLAVFNKALKMNSATAKDIIAKLELQPTIDKIAANLDLDINRVRGAEKVENLIGELETALKFAADSTGKEV
jgi:hypothetical protein